MEPKSILASRQRADHLARDETTKWLLETAHRDLKFTREFTQAHNPIRGIRDLQH
jgi:hypothetical protein